jgi:hypothetical protein
MLLKLYVLSEGLDVAMLKSAVFCCLKMRFGRGRIGSRFEPVLNLNRTSLNLEPGSGPRFSKFAEQDLRPGFSSVFGKLGSELDLHRTAATLLPIKLL